MMSIMVAFWLFVALFTIIGALRGWAKELLVIFSVILALFIIYILTEYLGFVKPFGMDPLTADMVSIQGGSVFTTLAPETQEFLKTQFWIRAVLVLVLAFFGYQTPALASFLNKKSRSDQVQDMLFGGILGAINGYMILGTLWSYMHSAYYLFESILPPEAEDVAWDLVQYFPPEVIGSDVGLFLAIGISFLFVLVVFI
ncbi:MAG: hypothetical protein B6I38_04520 [Anaerolineaceae bacterium 4572_5.1]|nr:MAG: hypothetical protein B6I38_04520 [Anaerolineaceae bacterium 4572_5.1]